MQTVIKGVASLLYSQPFLGGVYWSYALRHFVLTRNHCPNSRTEGFSPHKIIFKVSSIDLERHFLLPFGTLVSFGIPGELRAFKFSERNNIGIVLGEPVGTTQVYIILQPFTREILYRGNVMKLHVSYDQYAKWFAIYLRRLENKSPLSMLQSFLETSSEPYSSAAIQPSSALQPTGAKASPPASSNDPLPTRRLRSSGALINFIQFITSAQVEDLLAQPPSSVHDLFNESELAIVNSLSVAKDSLNVLRENNPKFMAAMTSPDPILREAWHKALRSEILGFLNVTETFRPLTPDEFDALVTSPGGYKRLFLSILCKRKFSAVDGSLDKFKVRAVGLGNLLKGMAEHTYSPTVSQLSFRLINQYSVIMKWHRLTIDITGAYLHQEYPSTSIPLVTQFHPKIAEICGLQPERQ
jgi:hypothetical protein